MMKWAYWFGWMTFGSALRSFFSMRIKGTEHLITEGGVLVAANHQSYLDPPIIGNIYQTEMCYLARKTLFTPRTTWLYSGWGAFPVDQERPDVAGLKSIFRRLKAGKRVAIFPEGTRTHDGSIGEAAPGIGMIAARSGAVIQPVRISGAHEALPRGSSFFRFKRITVTIGPAIRLTPEEIRAARSKEDYDRIANRIMDAIRAL